MIVYPLTYWDKRLHPKERIQGLRSEGWQTFALRESAVREAGVLAGEIRDKQSRSIWNAEGECISGVWYGRQLAPHPSSDAFWFAYAAFHPSTIIVPEPEAPWREQ